jgi:cytochrome b subunit of formate dehydrogenase
MEILRSAANPWGQDVLVGIAWDLMWLALIAGAVFVVAHGIYVRWIARPMPSEEAFVPGEGVPERVTRHTLPSRVFHWLMALAMFALLLTAFLPVVGIRFPWVTIHWIAGVVLTLTIVYHVLHAMLRQDLRSMWIGSVDVTEGSQALARFFRRSRGLSPKAGKYPLDHKLYHHAAAVVSVVAIVTGVLMMLRIDTPFWNQNPYFLSDSAWGIMYVLHGLSGVALITLIVAHIYFAVRPEKRWLTRSMVWGWIQREEYLLHHDPERWVLNRGPAGEVAGVEADRVQLAGAASDAEPSGGS